MDNLSQNSIIIIFSNEKIIFVGEYEKYISNGLSITSRSKKFLMDIICQKKITDMIFSNRLESITTGTMCRKSQAERNLYARMSMPSSLVALTANHGSSTMINGTKYSQEFNRRVQEVASDDELLMLMESFVTRIEVITVQSMEGENKKPMPYHSPSPFYYYNYYIECYFYYLFA